MSERYELKQATMNATDWMQYGNCRTYSPEVFFPSDAVGVKRAQNICAACEVAQFCLEYALEHKISDGVWGGESERSRKRILRQRKMSGK